MYMRNLTDATGKRMATALEKINGASETAVFPPADLTVLRAVYDAADKYHNFATGSIAGKDYAYTTDMDTSALSAFLTGIDAVYGHGEHEGLVAYLSTEFVRELLFEYSRNPEDSEIRFSEGEITTISGCPTMILPNTFLPSTTSFMIFGGEFVKRLNQLYSDKASAEEYEELFFEFQGRYYVHAVSTMGRWLDVDIFPGELGKVIIRINTPKEISTDSWFYNTKASSFELQDFSGCNPGSTCSTAQSWASGYVELTEAETEITPTSGHKYIQVWSSTAGSSSKWHGYFSAALPA